MDGDLLPWGMSWEQLERAARSCALAHPARSLLSFDQRYEAAFDGAVDALLESTLPPEWRDLITAGIAAIGVVAHAQSHHRFGTNLSQGTGERFAAYWIGSRRTGTDFTEDITDRIAAHQVWDALTDRDREILGALGDFGDNEAAARFLGMRTGPFSARLSEARRRAAALWFAPETAPHRPRRVLPCPGRKVPCCDYTPTRRRMLAVRRYRSKKPP
jgi:hypothetical protein